MPNERNWVDFVGNLFAMIAMIGLVYGLMTLIANGIVWAEEMNKSVIIIKNQNQQILELLSKKPS